MINIKNLTVKREEKIILQGLNLSLEAGKTHVIMGPNGSGKSTIAKTIAGHPDFSPTADEFTYDYQGKKINLQELPAFERSLRGIYLSFQYPTEIPGISNLTFLKTLYETHCEYQGANSNINDKEFIDLISQHLKTLQMSETFLHRSVNEGFSGGEKKKNEILQLLLLNPKFAILDEVDSGLDIDSLKVVSEGINSYKNSRNTLLLITHYQRLLNYIKPDFIHVMSQGKIIKTGGPELAIELEKRGYDWI